MMEIQGQRLTNPLFKTQCLVPDTFTLGATETGTLIQAFEK